MPSPEDEALEIAVRPDGTLDYDRYAEEYQQRLAVRQEQLRHDAQASFRAMEGWRTVKTPEAWQEKVAQVAEDLEGGRFLMERLGAERVLDPDMMAALLVLRRRLIEEHGAETAAELMLIDCAVLSYYQILRVNGWIDNLAMLLEADFFSTETLGAKLKGRYGTDKVRGLRAEDLVGQMAERLTPLVDRANRMLIRNLQALKDQRRSPAPSVQIGSAGQVNVANQQVNAATAAPAELPATREGGHRGTRRDARARK